MARRDSAFGTGVLKVAAGCAVLLILTSCSRGADGTGTAGAAGDGRAAGASPAGATGGRGARGGGAAVPVTTTPVVQKPMAVNFRAVGNVEPSSTVEVRAQITGAMTSVGFTEGRDVEAGQMLFTLDSRPLEVAVKQAEATLARDVASLQGLQAQLARSRDLFGRGLVAKSDLDAITTQTSALTATVAADQAVLDNAKLQVTYAKIVSPVAGRTGALLVHQGSLVRANDTSPLVVINQMEPVFVSFAVPAKLLPQLGDGRARGTLSVRATPGGAGAGESAGAVTFIDNAVDPSTDTVRVKATFPNKDRRLWPGAFVDVTLQLSIDQNALVVPQSAVLPSQQGQIVYVVKADQSVEVRSVRVARTEGNDVVIDSGLTAGETVVIDGQLRLTPGARVTTKAGGRTLP